MNEIILVKNGEIALKGLNRSTFEDVLIKNIKWRLKKLGKFEIKKAQSTIYITPLDENINLDEACKQLEKVFGIATFSRSLVTQKDLDVIKKDTVEYLCDLMPHTKTFKVAAKRSDKKFPYNSPQLQQELGDVIMDAFPNLKVDVHNPEITVTVEIRDFAAYVHAKVHKGAGGMPVGSSGEALLLISGGIDSPVAGYMMA
ncbi:MAG: THUMP domain-containing protein, partial [Oscillospiraceae bacterium]